MCGFIACVCTQLIQQENNKSVYIYIYMFDLFEQVNCLLTF